jgi:hypothetical protein
MAADERDLPGNREAERKSDELLKWRKSEVWSGWASVLVQGLVALAALGAVLIAIRATDAAREAIDATRDGIERQAHEDRLSTAVEAIGGDQPGERVGGLALLRRHVGSQLSAAIDEDGSDEDAAHLYTTALDVLENYLRNPPDDPTGGGLGYGTPDVPADSIYAANELQGMVSMRSEVLALDMDPDTGVDLARVQLRGQPWEGIDFSWLDGHYFAGIDLRGANLRGSSWGSSSLEGAFLQCADLDGAMFYGTNLSGADLSGANISGANFSGATVSETTQFDRVYYDGNRPPKGLDELPPITQHGLWEGAQKCMGHREYWADQE